MNKPRQRLGAGLLPAAIAFIALALGQAMAQSQPVAFQQVRVFDGAELLPATTVLIQDGLIVAMGDEVEIPEGAEVVDGSGMTLLPGLIDAHVHVFNPAMLRQALVFGVTTVLDMFTDEAFAAQMRQEQAKGQADGRADLYSSGTLATAPGGHGTQFGLSIDTLTAPEQAEGWLQDRVDAGADYIKIVIEDLAEMGGAIPTLDEATVRALVEAAHAHGLLAVTHVQERRSAQVAVEAGSDGLAHMFSDGVPSEEFVELMAAGPSFVIATLSVFQSVGADDPIDPTLANDPRIAPLLTPEDLQSLANPFHGFPQLSIEHAMEGIRLLHQAGVPVLAGTDAPNPGTAHGASMHRELELLTQAGLSPAEALAAATSVNAAVFGLDDRGRIAPGMVADLLLVAGDPTEDILATRDIAGVWKRGLRVDREAYGQELAEARQASQAQAEALAQAETAPVSDFEQGDLSVAFGQPWAETTDVAAGGDSTVQLRVVEGGAQDSAHALRIEGSVGGAFIQPWAGAMFMPGAQPFAPADLSAKPNLHFWARGDGGSYRIQLFCQNLGQVPPETSFQTGEDWQAYSFDLGEVGGCDTGGLMAVIFSAGAEGDFAFEIDEVAFR